MNIDEDAYLRSAHPLYNLWCSLDEDEPREEFEYEYSPENDPEFQQEYDTQASYINDNGKIEVYDDMHR